MKKFKLLILFGLFLFIPRVNAQNIIYNMDIDVDIQKDGSAIITENWEVKGSDGTEWYKVLNNMDNMRLSNFKVSMDGADLVYKDWNVYDNLNQKRGYYGINYTSEGLELCFGKFDYEKHTFTLSYKLSNFILNTDDSQFIYYRFIDILSNVNFKNYSITIKSYYEFPDTLDVWGYGYRGYAYVKDGVIKMANSGKMNNNYVVLLAKFPLETFNTNNRVSGYDNFNQVYKMADENTISYKYIWESILNFFKKVWEFVSYYLYIFILLIFLIIELVFKLSSSKRESISRLYGYKDNKKIDAKNADMFREIPCNKNIYYANALIKLNNFKYNKVNILGAIILRWIRDNKVLFIDDANYTLDLTHNPTFDNDSEKILFDTLYYASNDGLLELSELKEWCKSDYYTFFNILDNMTNDYILKLTNESHIYDRKDRKECSKKNVMDDMMYEDSKKLYGLKLYLEEFSKMGTKEVMEVKLWDEYLMFAYLFGIADKLIKQLKTVYPNMLDGLNIDYDMLNDINDILSESDRSSSSAKKRDQFRSSISSYSDASDYSGGGGGFSSGGGGGGSFGGGGGGSR